MTGFGRQSTCFRAIINTINSEDCAYAYSISIAKANSQPSWQTIIIGPGLQRATFVCCQESARMTMI